MPAEIATFMYKQTNWDTLMTWEKYFVTKTIKLSNMWTFFHYASLFSPLGCIC